MSSENKECIICSESDSNTTVVKCFYCTCTYCYSCIFKLDPKICSQCRRLLSVLDKSTQINFTDSFNYHCFLTDKDYQVMYSPKSDSNNVLIKLNNTIIPFSDLKARVLSHLSSTHEHRYILEHCNIQGDFKIDYIYYDTNQSRFSYFFSRFEYFEYILNGGRLKQAIEFTVDIRTIYNKDTGTHNIKEFAILTLPTRTITCVTCSDARYFNMAQFNRHCRSKLHIAKQNLASNQNNGATISSTPDAHSNSVEV